MVHHTSLSKGSKIAYALALPHMKSITSEHGSSCFWNLQQLKLIISAPLFGKLGRESHDVSFVYSKWAAVLDGITQPPFICMQKKQRAC